MVGNQSGEYPVYVRVIRLENGEKFLYMVAEGGGYEYINIADLNKKEMESDSDIEYSARMLEYTDPSHLSCVEDDILVGSNQVKKFGHIDADGKIVFESIDNGGWVGFEFTRDGDDFLVNGVLREDVFVGIVYLY